MTRSSDLFQASTALSTAGGQIETTEGKLRVLKEGLESMVDGLAASWQSPDSEFLQNQGAAVAPALAPALTALEACRQAVVNLSVTAEVIATQLAEYEAQMDAAAATIQTLSGQLHTADAEDGSLGALMGQINAAQAQYNQAQQAHAEAVALWRQAVRSATTTVEGCRPVVQQLLQLSLLTPESERSFDPFHLLGLGVPWADRGITAIERGALSYRGPRLYTVHTTEFHQRITHRQGHWVRPEGRAPYWRRGHLVRVGGPQEVLRLSYVPNSAWYRAQRIARRAGPIGTVLTFGGAGLGEFNQVRNDPSLSTSQQVTRTAGATLVVGGAATGGAVLGMKAGAAAGAVIGSFIPVPVLGTGAGAVIGGAVGAVVGSEIGGRVGSYAWDKMRGGANAVGSGIDWVGDRVGDAAGAAKDALGDGADWVGDRVGDVAGGAKDAIGGFIRWASPS